MGNIKDPIAPVEVLMQYKKCWANKKSPQKI